MKKGRIEEYPLNPSMIFNLFRTNEFSTEMEYVVPAGNSAWQSQFDVKLPDFYTLYVRADVPQGVTNSIHTQQYLPGAVPG